MSDIFKCGTSKTGDKDSDDDEEFENFKPVYSIQVRSRIFFAKLGKYPESYKIFQLCNFKLEPENEPIFLTAEKNRDLRDEIVNHVKNFKYLLKIGIW